MSATAFVGRLASGARRTGGPCRRRRGQPVADRSTPASPRSTQPTMRSGAAACSRPAASLLPERSTGVKPQSRSQRALPQRPDFVRQAGHTYPSRLLLTVTLRNRSVDAPWGWPAPAPWQGAAAAGRLRPWIGFAPLSRRRPSRARGAGTLPRFPESSNSDKSGRESELGGFCNSAPIFKVVINDFIWKSKIYLTIRAGLESNFQDWWES